MLNAFKSGSSSHVFRNVLIDLKIILNPAKNLLEEILEGCDSIMKELRFNYFYSVQELLLLEIIYLKSQQTNI
jgi:hypothetical protein